MTHQMSDTARLQSVLFTAMRVGESGIVEWVSRAYDDAMTLGRLRDRDRVTLERLEGTFSDDFYRDKASARIGNPIYA